MAGRFRACKSHALQAKRAHLSLETLMLLIMLLLTDVCQNNSSNQLCTEGLNCPLVQAAVETQRKYKHVLWYSLFVAAYLIVLYLQASAYNSGEVVSTLRNALMPSKPH